jgi:outer membrane assembly lipoprotein YfiO
LTSLPSTVSPEIRRAALTLALAAVAACQAYPYSKKSPDDLYADAGVDIANGRGSSALAKLDFLKSKFPDYPDKEGVEFRVAEATKVQGNYWRAFVAFRDFSEHYPLTSRYGALENNLYETGSLLIQSRASLLGTGLVRDADDGVAVLEYFIERFPTTDKAAEALHQIGEYKYEIGDFAGAVNAYQRIVNAYRGSPWLDKAEYRIPICHLRGVRRPELDQAELVKAREEFRAYLSTRAEGARRNEARAALRECEEMLAASEYSIGEFYRVIGEPFGAAIHYKIALTEYPGTVAASQAEARITEADAKAAASRAATP